jgi:hypothetical protein
LAWGLAAPPAADGESASNPRADGPRVGDLRENVTLTASEPDYARVNPLQISGPGTVDLAKIGVHITGYAV